MFSVRRKSILFAPMEGVTDANYRKVLAELYPEWDYFSTDFLRIPTGSCFKEHHLVEHLGEEIYANKLLMDKTLFQILVGVSSDLNDFLELLNMTKITQLDLNLGCPSKRVNSHQGGAYLLGDHDNLNKILQAIRTKYRHFFSVKIRIGVHDDNDFLEILRIINEANVDGLTVHARTRDQLYKGVANWDYIKTAVENSKAPVVANGDIWTISDCENIFQRTNCHAIMLGRSALKTPWMAPLLKGNFGQNLNNDDLLNIRTTEILKYFKALYSQYAQINLEEPSILKRFKALSRYLFDDYNKGEELKTKFMRTKSLGELFDLLEMLPSYS